MLFKNRILLRSLFILITLYSGTSYSNARNRYPPNAENRCDTVPLLLNTVAIYNDSSLSALFQKLLLLKKGEGSNVSVLHLGDSHVQMGYFAAAIRNTFATTWGLAGWGSIFPYQIAKFNPYYVQTKITSGEWEGSNYLKDEKEFKHGLMGFTARTFSAQASFELNVRNNAPDISGFNKVQLLYGDVAGNYSIQLKGSSSQKDPPAFSPATACNEESSVTTKQAWQKQTYCFDEMQDKISLSVSRDLSSRGEFNVYGFLLEDKNRKGVIYNNCGVGGSQFSSLYNNASLSKEQIASLHPDLIIFSYGSNESYMKSFDSVKYQGMVTSYLHSLKQMVPGVAILLTTPPDTRFKNMYPRNTTTIQRILKTAAKQEGVALLDLREQMGGDGSILRWLPLKLAAPDKLHFTKEGYTLQANLLMQSLLQSYNATVPETDKVPDIQFGNYIFGYTPGEKNGGMELPDKMKNK